MINTFIKKFPESSSCLKTLKECSFDIDNNVFLTNSPHPAYNYDDIKTKYASNIPCKNDCLSSVDSLLEIDGKLLWIEFKNKNITKSETISIKRKASESLLIFIDVTKFDLKQVHDNSEFILVFNKNKNPALLKREQNKKIVDYQGFNTITDNLAKLSGDHYIHFGLDSLELAHFKRVYTLSSSEFENFCHSHHIATQ